MLRVYVVMFECGYRKNNLLKLKRFNITFRCAQADRSSPATCPPSHHTHQVHSFFFLLNDSNANVSYLTANARITYPCSGARPLVTSAGTGALVVVRRVGGGVVAQRDQSRGHGQPAQRGRPPRAARGQPHQQRQHRRPAARTRLQRYWGRNSTT